jgi:hypothetical protein
VAKINIKKISIRGFSSGAWFGTINLTLVLTTPKQRGFN